MQVPTLSMDKMTKNGTETVQTYTTNGRRKRREKIQSKKGFSMAVSATDASIRKIQQNKSSKTR